MACGVALKRPFDLVDFSPEGSAKRPRTSSHCSPFRPTFAAAATAADSSPFASASANARLNSQQLDSYLRAEIRYLRRRRLIPRRQMAPGDFRAPSSPHQSSDSEGEAVAPKAARKSNADDKPLFSLDQVRMICERLLQEQETRLRNQYSAILNTKLLEQYETFVKFTQDQIRRNMDQGADAELSYLS